MPDMFCPKLRFDEERGVGGDYCGLQGIGFPCMHEDNSLCGKYEREHNLSKLLDIDEIRYSDEPVLADY